jgi:hypothetical protein
MSSFIMTISRTIFFRLLAHAPEELQREAKENARGVIPALCFTEDDIRKIFALEELWDELSDIRLIWHGKMIISMRDSGCY